jgi:hypothetical protein
MAPPTRDDAQLMLQLMQWGSTLGLQTLLPQIFDDEFDPETADASNDEAVRAALTYGETIGTLTKHELLSLELVHDLLWIDGLWSRVGPAALRSREKFGEPRLYENFEALASSA